MMWRMTSRNAALLLVTCLVLSGCSLLSGDEEERPARIDPLTSMTEAGVRLAGTALEDAPRYDGRAEGTPGTGRVRGTVRAELPVGTGAPAIAGFDINLDGTQDVIVSNETDNTITALFSI